MVIFRSGGAQTFLDAYNRTGNATFEDESFIFAGQKIQEWVEKGYYPEGCNGINYDTGGSRMLFYTEQAAHIVQTNSFISNCKSEQPDIYDKLGVFNYPVIEGAKGSASEILGGGNGYSISASTKYPEESMELVKYLTDQEYAQDMSDSSGITTGVKGVVIKDEKLKLMEDLLVNSSYMQNFYDQFLPPALGNLHKQTTYDLFGLTTTPEKAASDMEALAQELDQK
ncbi:MAG: extracellular solute-binding protein [Lachnospiraceae bacterium]|nr:extracellular solute-binding protein [Lachnospiraceae bacterium]